MPQANKPAMTSGPGALSRRTDGGPASKQAQRYIAGMPNYGDGQELMDLQASAPMAATKTPAATPLSSMAPQQPQAPQAQPQQPITPLLAPTQRPNEPVTQGGALGPGAGPEILGLPQMPQGGQTARQAVQALAAHPDASPELKQLAASLGK